MSKYPKKPKLSKMPKRPKANASVSVWERYEVKCKQVEKNNADNQKEYKKTCASIDAENKRKQAIIKRTSTGLSGIKKTVKRKKSSR